MFEFNKFYNGLLHRTNYFDNYWEQFPKGRLIQFKRQTLSLLKDNFKNKDEKGLACTISILCWDGADTDYTDILLSLLDETWHTLEEDIVSVLELIKDPKSVNKLYEIAINVPDYDDMRALAKKCMWALSAINTSEALQKLALLQNSNDSIIKENASFHLNQILNKS